MTPPFVLTTQAEADLRGIAAFSEERWGETQARRYLARLRDCATAVASGTRPYKDLTAWRPGLRR